MYFRTLCCYLLGSLLLVSPAMAQSDGRVPPNRYEGAYLLTVLVPSLENSDAQALVIRRSDHIDRNIIVLTAEANPADFLRALRALQKARAEIPTVSEGEHRAYLPRGERAEPLRKGASATPIGDHLRRLREATPREIPGIGNFPAVLTRLREPSD